MSSGTSTRPSSPAAGSFQAWHLYLLLGMAGATVAVWRAQDTQPAALLLLSAAVLAAGLTAIAVHYTVLGFLGEAPLEREPLNDRVRARLEQEKAVVLRSIKELEFDRAMRKVSDADFVELETRLRARAVSLMKQLESTPAPSVEAASPGIGEVAGTCSSCHVANDTDARFCKGCGQKLS